MAKTERSFIVGYRPQRRDKNTPSLTLSSNWLRETGFETGRQISVKVMDGCIVLMAYDEKKQKLFSELQEMQQKLKGIEEALAAVHSSLFEPVSLTYSFSLMLDEAYPAYIPDISE
ncbi:type I toxin-antitoxin system SymE family toxin [Salmonella enterica]|nr:type I toxin-antitoxin system SymE family toxin [Salmonella enterica]EHM1749600.1 type I toxin-antitoxin system SymE family toxin [Salmonella enterica subsp. salamae serovar 40:c:e,n,x,z15]HCM2000713.1 type I toxin-antitoxin system SymE family toxin [Salmonella enterica subsp. salamae serovar [1],40:z35:e,n,x,z15]EEO8347048.1 type I toxin-antitoxin system SymE family toxin [Salmonella enterica]EIC8290832.1 type I toxin-antitoxin system SymE family toxin [Salmonella enterica]